MRILVFSDSHLTAKFDQKKYDFMSGIIGDSDQVIINGDFWDGYVITFDQFIKSEWSKLFPKLKRKKTAYLYGNHDREDFSDHRVTNFSTEQQYRLFIKTSNKELVVEHGNKYLKFIDEKVNLSQSDMISSFADFSLNYERFLVRNFGTGLIKRLYQRYNDNLKKQALKDLKSNQIIVCGHTHLIEVDLKNNFINSGIVNYGLGQYLIIEGDEIIDREVWYDPPKLEETLDPELYANQTEFIIP